MRPGREIDTRIAMEVFGYDVWIENEQLFEKGPLGHRPLRKYSKETEWAFEVAKAMRVAILPIQGGDWFAFIGPEGQDGWASPTAMLELLNGGDFTTCGASVNQELPLAICEAALKALEKRRAVAEEKEQAATTGQPIEAKQQPQLTVVEKQDGTIH